MGFIQEIKKAVVGTREGFSYRGASLWYGDTIKSTTELYYKLYRQNTDLRRCIEELYQGVGRDGYVFKKGDTIVENQKAEEMITQQYDFHTFKSLIVRDLMIAGNVYVLKLKNAMNGIAGYQILDPRTMRVVANKYGEIVGYIQTVANNSETYTPDEIFHFKDMLDHDNEVFGISKVETLVYDILGDTESAKSNYSYFKNNAIPSSIIVLDNELQEDEAKVALEQLKKQFSGGENKHRISASTGIKDIKVLGSTMKDMEYAVLRAFTTERICSAMGVPKTILGYSDSVNYSTSDNQYRKFIENTIRPLTYQVEQFINELIEETGVTIEFLDNFAFDMDEKVARFEKMIGMGTMTINEVREDLGFDTFKEPYADLPLIKQWFEPLSDVWLQNVTEINNATQ